MGNFDQVKFFAHFFGNIFKDFLGVLSLKFSFRAIYDFLKAQKDCLLLSLKI